MFWNRLNESIDNPARHFLGLGCFLRWVYPPRPGLSEWHDSETGNPERPGLGVGGDGESVVDDDSAREALLLEFNGVAHGGRRTGASSANANHYHVRSRRNLFECFL